MRDTIVVGVDGSAAAHGAVRMAADWADRSGADLLLVHVLGERLDGVRLDERPGASTGRPSSRAHREASVRGEDLLARGRAVALAAVPGLAVATAVLDGDPMWVLARELPEARAIVVGSHRTGFLRGSSFGASSLQLATASTAPVVVVPATADPVARGVVVGLDDAPDGLAALDAAIRHAHERADDLLIVRATPAGTAPENELRGSETGDPRDAENVGDATDAVDADMLARARARAERLHPELTVRTRLVRGTPSQALVRLSGRAALLVLGVSRSQGPASALGRVTHDALLNLATTTVVVAAAHERSLAAAHAPTL